MLHALECLIVELTVDLSASLTCSTPLSPSPPLCLPLTFYLNTHTSAPPFSPLFELWFTLFNSSTLTPSQLPFNSLSCSLSPSLYFFVCLCPSHSLFLSPPPAPPPPSCVLTNRMLQRTRATVHRRVGLTISCFSFSALFLLSLTHQHTCTH